MKNISACLSSNSDDWKTPSPIYNTFITMNYIDCFPFQSEINQFDIDYHNEKLFINPPFSIMDDVIEYVLKQYKKNNQIALLIPVRTDTKYFKRLFDNTDCVIYLIHKRLHYNDDKSAPFPSMLIMMNQNIKLKNRIDLIEQNDIERVLKQWQNKNIIPSVR